MSILFSESLTIPTREAGTFISLSAIPSPITREACEQLPPGLDCLFEANGSLSEYAELLLRPIRSAPNPFSLYSISPGYSPSRIHRLCAFSDVGQTTVLRSMSDASTTEITVVDTSELPQLIVRHSPIGSRKNRLDGPTSIATGFIDMANHGDYQEASLLLNKGLTQKKKGSKFAVHIREGEWEYTNWARWRRTPGGYKAQLVVSALSTPLGTYLVDTDALPESYLTHEANFMERMIKPHPKTAIEACTQAMLWKRLAPLVVP